jgi:hypothetical protein
MNNLEKYISVIVIQILAFLGSYCLFNLSGLGQTQPDLILVLSLMNSALLAVISIDFMGDK